MEPEAGSRYIATMAAAKVKTVTLDHVACGVPSISAAIPLLEGTLRTRPHRRGPSPEFFAAQWAFEGDGRLELLEPAGPEGGFMHRFLQSRGAGVHHATFKVPDLHAARARAQAAGFEVIGFNDANPGWKECFLHPKQAMGLVVQMAESDPDVDSSTWLEFGPTLERPGDAPGATFLGLRLAVRSLETATRLWGEAACAASVRREGGEAFFNWDDSPLTLHVVETDEYPEGPLGLEVRLPNGMRLEQNPPPSIGARLLIQP